MNESSDIDTDSPTEIRPGTESRDDPRICEAIECYVNEVEAGKRPERSEFLVRYADIAEQLNARLQDLESLDADADNTADPQNESDGDILEARTSLGDFRLNEPIGRGGMGIVYKATQLSLDRTVAVKVLPFAAMLDERQRKRFRNEARAAANLDHPNIVPIYFVGQDRGVHFYAMQLIEGQSLAELIASWRTGLTGQSDRHFRTTQKMAQTAESKNPKQDFTSAINSQLTNHPSEFFRSIARLGVQAAEALEHAHQIGIVHRDVKPGNLLVDSTGKLWVTDFGLACFDNDEHLTRSGGIVGTAAYMSPEQAIASRNVDPRSDIYSLGATLGDLLIPGRSASEATTRIQSAPLERSRFTSLRRRDTRIPIDLETIILKAVNLEPRDRYQTAQAMADDLQLFCENRDIKARRLSVREHVARWLGRHRILAVVVSLVCVLLSAATVAATMWWSAWIAQHAWEVETALSEKNRALESAEAAQLLADRERIRAERNLLRAEASELTARKISYRSDIQLAFEHWNRRNWSVMERILRRQYPDATQTDLRSSEWFILQQELRAKVGLRGRHNGEATECVVFPDGTTAATVGTDGAVRIWDLSRENLITAHLPNVGPLHAVAVSPDGQTLAIGGTPIADVDDLAYVHLLDVATGKTTGFVQKHDTTIESIAFSPDGNRIAGSSRYERTQVCRIDGTSLHELVSERRCETVAFLPDSSAVVMAPDGEHITIWNYATDEARNIEHQTGRHPAQVVVSPDGQTIAVTFTHVSQVALLNTTDESVRWLKADDPEPRRMRCIAFHPDGSELVGGDTDGRVHRWTLNADDGPAGGESYHSATAAVSSFASHHNSVSDLAVSPAGMYLTTSDDGTVRSATPAREATRRLPLEVAASTLTVSDLDSVYFGTFDGIVGRRNLQSGQTSTITHAVRERVADLAVHNRQLAVAYATGRLDVIDSDSGQTEWTPVEESEPGRDYRVAFSPDGQWLASTGTDNYLRLWDVAQHKLIFEKALTRDGSAVVFSPDSRLVACGSDRTQVLAVGSGKVIHEFAGNDGIYSLRFSPDGRYLATGGANFKAQLLNLRTGATSNLPGHQEVVAAVCFGEDSKTLISLDTARDGGTIRLWDVESGESFGAISSPLQHQGDREQDHQIHAFGRSLVVSVAAAEQSACYVWDLNDE